MLKGKGKGKGVDQDSAEAVKWYRKAAQQGDAKAQVALGWAYMLGNGVRVDCAEAAMWYQKAVENREWGDIARSCLLSCWVDLGESFVRANNWAEAVNWHRKAAEQGDAGAQAMLGGAYAHGLGVQKNAAEAAKWSLKAADQYRGRAEQGDADCQSNLAGCYASAGDHPEAVKWYWRAAEQDVAIAQQMLGQYYEEGNGVPEDDIEAYKWFSLAVAQGVPATSRDALSSRMARAEIIEGQRRAAAFVARKESPGRSPSPGPQPRSGSAIQQAAGTAFFVTEDGYLVTSFHVVADAARIIVRTAKGPLTAKLISADKVNDVALLKVDGTFTALPLAASRAATLGQTVFTIGFPNPDLQGLAPKLTKGEISSLTGVQDDPREFQISVPVQPGNSGGPLVNQYGNVEGIVKARLADIATLKSTGSLPQNVNYAVKSSVLSVLLESLPGVSSKLKKPYPPKDLKFEDVVRETEGATALILVY